MDERFYVELGQQIRRARNQRGCTQADLAVELGISRTSLTNIECGRQRMLVDQLVRTAEKLGVPLADLVPAPQTKTSPASSPRSSLAELPTVSRWVAATRGSPVGSSG